MLWGTCHFLVARELDGVERERGRRQRLHEEVDGLCEALDGAEAGSAVVAVEEEVLGGNARGGRHHLKDVVREQRQRGREVARQQRQLQHVHVRRREVRRRRGCLARSAAQRSQTAAGAAARHARVAQPPAQRGDCVTQRASALIKAGAARARRGGRERTFVGHPLDLRLARRRQEAAGGGYERLQRGVRGARGSALRVTVCRREPLLEKARGVRRSARGAHRQ